MSLHQCPHSQETVCPTRLCITTGGSFISMHHDVDFPCVMLLLTLSPKLSLSTIMPTRVGNLYIRASSFCHCRHIVYIFLVLLAQALWTLTVRPSSSFSADGTTSAMPLQDGTVSTGVHLHPLCLQGLARPECTVLLKMTAAWLNSTACDGYNIESDWDHWRPEMEWRSFKSSKR